MLESPGDAVCLDGTTPGYYYRQGIGNGTKGWIIHLEGGGWCYNEVECLERSKTRLGSSKSWSPTADFSGFLSDDSTANPDFYNWNVVFINYCDGASFSGSVDGPVDVQGTSIYFRGFKILQGILKQLLNNGMNQASEVILTGCSAGGLATYLHADYVGSVLPSNVKYHAIADAGYFIDAPNVNGEHVGRQRVQNVFKMQNAISSLNKKCIAATPNDTQWQCMSAQYTYPYISTPIFSLNSMYDTWQIKNTLELGCNPPQCTPEQMKQLEKFFEEFKSAAQPIMSSSTNGAFLDSCFKHCQSLSDASWNGIKVGGQTAAETFGNWYYQRTAGEGKEIDCDYPCNTSC
jgi:hypothetical protein